MEAQQLEDWVDILDTTNYAPHKDPDNIYQSYRFVDLDINSAELKLTEHYEKLRTLRFQKSMQHKIGYTIA